ncbi:MAG: protein translocase SEC61 complex subunit gamma [Candidatus Aenigmarchaeota archaeon]|nr:protein translocase SEC61 complex subunit gamma [Candidatus Aenigmarchaeota archaeon]
MDENNNQEQKQENQNIVSQTNNIEKKHVEKPKERKPGLIAKLINTIKQYQRVLYVAQKPDKQEFMSSLKISLIGITILGVIGYIIFLIYNLVF